jgi:hypothetical protein
VGDLELARERAADLARPEGIRLLEDSFDIETGEGAATIGLEVGPRRRSTPTCSRSAAGRWPPASVR